MIIKNKKEVRIVYKGDKACFCSFKGENLVYGTRNSFTAETYKILKENFPTKIGEIIEYANRHPKIVPFINEYPMLVCSLGIEGMPISVLVCLSGASIETGIISTTETILKTDIMFTGTSGGVHLGRVNHTDSDDWRAMNINGTLYWDCGSGRMTRSFPLNSRKKLELGNNYTIVDGVKNTGGIQSNIYANRIAVALDGALNIYGSMEIFDGSIWHEFVPYKTGLLDLSSMTYNQGADGNVTIEYALPDGTPWQPTT